MTRIALEDCNNFFCSCERVFIPALMGKPIVVLSNNDGASFRVARRRRPMSFESLMQFLLLL